MKKQRKLINFFIEPKTQIRILLQTVFLLVLFFAFAVYLGYEHWKETIGLLVEMSDVPDVAKNFVIAQLTGFITNVILLLLVLFIFLSALIIVHTHRFLGARYAICKHVNDNLKKLNFSKPLTLRKNDYLIPIADSLNELCDILQKKDSQ